MMLAGAEKIVVRTFPDGYKDCRVGSVFSDAPSALILHSWAKDKAFSAKDVQIKMTLPENFKITRFSICRSPREGHQICAGKSVNGEKIWTLDAGPVPYNVVYKRSSHPWRPEVPWTDGSVIVFIRPEGTVPDKFEVKWEISGENLEKESGVMKLYTMKAPKLTKRPKEKVAWSLAGGYGSAFGKTNYTDMLKTMHDAGITTLLEAGGYWLPDALYPVKDLPKLGLEPMAFNNLDYAQRFEPEDLRKAGFNVTDGDLKLDASGKRIHTRKDKKVKQIYCFTAMVEKDSPVRAHMRAFYKKYTDKGFHSFWTDYEPYGYNGCYCEKCRRAFAKFANADEAECLKMSPGELVYKYPYEWYAYRCHMIGRLLALLSKEIGAPVGWNSNLGHQDYFIPCYDSYGLDYFAEDPRIFDPYVAYHSADTLGTALEGVYALEAFMQKKSNGEFAVKKPVVVRATSLHWVSWFFTCIYGRYELAREKGFDGLGTDYRRKLHRLEVAQDFAIGAGGVEVGADPFTADAEALTGISEGIQYAADFEDYIRREYRQDRQSVKLFDCTGVESPYESITKRGYLSNWFRAAAAKYGNLQTVIHRNKDWLLLSVFNWDYYQDKKLRLEIPPLPAEKCYLNISLDNEKFTIKTPVTQKDLDNGLSIELPAGSFMAVLLSPEALFPVRDMPVPHFSGGKIVTPYVPGTKHEGMKPFYEYVYNAQIRPMMAQYPEAGFKLIDLNTRK